MCSVFKEELFEDFLHLRLVADRFDPSLNLEQVAFFVNPVKLIGYHAKLVNEEVQEDALDASILVLAVDY